MITIRKQRVLALPKGPCRCGCEGSDPMHREFYRRSVTVTSTDPETTDVKGLSLPIRTDMRGRVSLPWGVVDTVRDLLSGTWYLCR